MGTRAQPTSTHRRVFRGCAGALGITLRSRWCTSSPAPPRPLPPARWGQQTPVRSVAGSGPCPAQSPVCAWAACPGLLSGLHPGAPSQGSIPGPLWGQPIPRCVGRGQGHGQGSAQPPVPEPPAPALTALVQPMGPLVPHPRGWWGALSCDGLRHRWPGQGWGASGQGLVAPGRLGAMVRGDMRGL